MEKVDDALIQDPIQDNRFSEDIIQNQLVNLSELGIDYSEYLDELDRDFIYEMVIYCHDNYLPITSLTQYFDNDIYLRFIFEHIYRLYVIDLYRFIQEYGNYINLYDDEDQIRDFFEKNFAWRRVRSVLKVDPQSEVPGLQYEKIKYIFYTELFDSDISSFISCYLSTLLRE